MVVARPAFAVGLLVLAGLSFAAPQAVACHDTVDGCLACSSKTTVSCDARDHPAGTIAGVVVHAVTTLADGGSYEESIAGGGSSRQGYVLFTFSRSGAAQPVDLDVEVDGGVSFDDAGQNLTYTGTDEQELRFEFTTDGERHNIRFTVRATAQGQAPQTLEGSFAVPASDDGDGVGPGDWFRRYWTLALLIFLVGIVVGLLFARLRAATPRGTPPLSA